MSTNKALILARKHLGNGSAMDSSARLCMEDAIALSDKGDYFASTKAAMRSLSYSVGVFHDDYKKIAKEVRRCEGLIAKDKPHGKGDRLAYR